MLADSGRTRQPAGASTAVRPNRVVPSIPGSRAATVSNTAQRTMAVPPMNHPHAAVRNETGRPSAYKPAQPKMLMVPPPVYRPHIQPKMAPPPVYRPAIQPKMVPPPVYQPNAAVASPKLRQRTAPSVAFGTVSSRTPGSTPLGRPVAPRAIQRAANPGADRKPSVIQPVIISISDDDDRFNRGAVINKVFGGNHQIKSLKMLSKNCLKKPEPGLFDGFFGLISSRPKETLIVNGHGNEDELADLSPENLFNVLLNAGLNDTDYDKVILVACSVGKGYKNFATEFRSKVTQTKATAQIKVYAPIGDVTYDFQMKPHPKEATLKVVDLENSKMSVEADYGSGLEERAVTTGGGGGGFRLVTA